MIIDKALLWWLLIKIVMKHVPFYISSCYNWGILVDGGYPKYSKSHNFWNFNDVLLRYIEEKSCNFLKNKFSSNFMQS